jgi:hypothetical protein
MGTYDCHVIRKGGVYYQIKLWKRDTPNKIIIFRNASLLSAEYAEPENSVVDFPLILKDDLFIENQNGPKKTLLTERMKNLLKNFVIFILNIRLFFYKVYKLDILDNLTVSSMALKSFRTSYYDERTNPLVTPDKVQDKFIRESYMGGVVEVFKPKILNGFYYDFNSLYPYVMKTNAFPIGFASWHDLFQEKNFDVDNFFGFIEVKVFAPKLYIPFLYKKHKSGMISYSECSWEGVYFSEEIKYALTLGYKFLYKRGLRYSKSQELFKSYVEINSKIKEKYDSIPSLRTISKLMLNSLYGRFGVKEYTDATITDESKVSEYRSYRYKIHHNVERFSENKVLIQYTDSYKNKFSPISAVQVASAIAAYSRIEMDKLKRISGADLYYSDTDSIVVSRTFDSCFVDQKQLGKLKLVYKIKEGLFLSPKFYYIIIENDEQTTVIKSKGVQEGKICVEEMNEFYKNIRSFMTIEQSNFKKQNSPLVSSYPEQYQTYNLSAKDLKRHKVFKDNIWVDTSPFTFIETESTEDVN